MENQAKSNLVISGTTEAIGGTYNAIKIYGEGKFSGDMHCDSLRCYGKAEIGGHTSAKVAKIYGSTIIAGNYLTESTTILGEADIAGDLSFQEINCFGSVSVKGTMSGDTVKLKGELKASKDVEAERFLGTGGFTIDGLLNAGEINVNLFGPCRAREIGGENIKVKIGGPLHYLNRLFGSHAHGSLMAQVIEGDEIYLENTKAGIVRGNSVTIGPGCVIERVEYKHHFVQDKGAKVNQFTQK